LNDLVYGATSCVDPGRTGQVGASIRERQGSGDSAVTSVAGDLRTQAKAITAFVSGRETNVGGTGNEAESQDGADDHGDGRGHSDRETGHAFRLASAVGPPQVDVPPAPSRRTTTNRPGDRVAGGAAGA